MEAMGKHVHDKLCLPWAVTGHRGGAQCLFWVTSSSPFYEASSVRLSWGLGIKNSESVGLKSIHHL